MGRGLPPGAHLLCRLFGGGVGGAAPPGPPPPPGGGRAPRRGKAAGRPVATLPGGRRQERFPLYIAVPLGGAEEMAHYVLDRRAEGIHRFQLKLGGRPSDDAERVRRVVEVTDDEDIIIADANGGWRVQDAIVAARLLEDFPRVYLEQPCPTLEECAQVRRGTALPLS